VRDEDLKGGPALTQPVKGELTVRAALAFAATLTGLYLSTLHHPSTTMAAGEAALGLLLLAWYARE
jgi:hypothetical protein